VGHYPIDNSDIPIRLFKWIFWNSFHTSVPVAIIIIWSPVIVYFLYRSFLIRPAGGSLWYIPAGFLIACSCGRWQNIRCTVCFPLPG